MELEEQVVVSGFQKEATNKVMKKAGLFFGLLMLIEIPLASLIPMVAGMFEAKYSVLVSILMTQGYILLAGMLYCLVTKQHFINDLQMKKYRISTFFLSIVVLMTAMPMANWLNVFSQLFAKNTTGTAIFNITQTVPMWLAIIIIGCLPGFVEEMVYRGIMYSAFRKRSILTGIIISSLAFGLMHLNFNQMAYAIYLGIVFALLVEATGSVVSSMILHMLFNAVNTAYLYILPMMYEFLGEYSPEYADFDMEAAMNVAPEKSMLILMAVVLMPIAIVGVVLTILLLKQIAKMNGRELSWTYIKGIPEEVKQTHPWNGGLILGFAICLAFCILNMISA